MEKVLIITGGNKGLGLALSKEYHKNGYQIISIARNNISKLYAIEQYSCDLSKLENIESTFKEIFNHLDLKKIKKIVLINNAATLGVINSIDHLTPVNISYAINLNLTAPMVINSIFIRKLKNKNIEKKIFNISSGAAINPYSSWSTYCTSKAGLDMMTKVIAKEQKDAKNKVTIATIYPGVLDTNMQVELRNTPKEKFKHVQRFIDLFEQNELTSPTKAAQIIFDLDNCNTLKNGQIVDIRHL